MKKLVSITAIALVLALALGGAAFAADKIWAKGTPTVIVGFGAGGGTDTSVRPMIVLMSKYLGETINVANMPGAASAVAAEHVLGLPADGYTMFATGSGCFGGFKVKETSNSGWVEWTSWHPFQGPAAILTSAKGDLKTFGDVAKALKEGKINMGVSGFGNERYNPRVAGSGTSQSTGIYDLSVNVRLSSDDVVTSVLYTSPNLQPGQDAFLNSDAPAGPTTRIPPNAPTQTQGTTTSFIDIADTRQIIDLNVRVRITHPFPGDLTISLLGPSGTEVTLVNRRGGSQGAVTPAFPRGGRRPRRAG